MSEITNQQAQRVAMLLTASVKTVMLYPKAHPAVGQPLQELVGILVDMLQQRAEIHLGVVEGTFFLESRLIVSPNAAVAALVERLGKKKIDALTIRAGVTEDDL